MGKSTATSNSYLAVLVPGSEQIVYFVRATVLTPRSMNARVKIENGHVMPRDATTRWAAGVAEALEK